MPEPVQSSRRYMPGLDGLRAIAETGVDDISIGALTKGVEAVDLSMRLADGAGALSEEGV